MGKEFENSNYWLLVPVASLFFIWASVASFRNHYWITFFFVALMPCLILLVLFFGKLIMAMETRQYLWLAVIFPLWIAGTFFIIKPEFSYHTFYKSESLRIRFNSPKIISDDPLKMEVVLHTKNRCMITKVVLKTSPSDFIKVFETWEQIPLAWRGSLDDRNYCLRRFDWVPTPGFAQEKIQITVYYEMVVREGGSYDKGFPVKTYELVADL